MLPQTVKLRVYVYSTAMISHNEIISNEKYVRLNIMNATRGNADVVSLDSVPIQLVGIIQTSALCRILCVLHA